MKVNQIISELKKNADPNQAKQLSRFFKTGPGEYGEGDVFMGLRVPFVRKVAKKFFKELSLKEVKELIKNPYHEIRLCAVLILVLKYEKADEQNQEIIYKFYLDHVEFINNWDLVDVTAQYVVGAYLFGKDHQKLWELAKSNHLWSERISVLSTFYFIRHGKFQTALELCEHFLNHPHDLMHKACGWMLREIGKRDLKPLYAFLDQFHKEMPRTMLRYAIEKLTPSKKKHYMKR